MAIRPRKGAFRFETPLAPKSPYIKRLTRQAGARVGRAQVRQGSDQRTGKLLSPRRRGKLGVCWRLSSGIHSNALGAIFVPPKDQKNVTNRHRTAIEACPGGGAPIEWPPKGFRLPPA